MKTKAKQAKQPYETFCESCTQPIMDCACEAGPTIPGVTPTVCPICGADGKTAEYKKSLWSILSSTGKEARQLAKQALGV